MNWTLCPSRPWPTRRPASATTNRSPDSAYQVAVQGTVDLDEDF
ncbi:hypothetical protein [Streptomyces sp. NPDC003487]